jgi:hypothetical protein
MKLKFSRYIFEKYSNINLRQIRSVWVELFQADIRTDNYANSRFPQFYERAYKPYIPSRNNISKNIIPVYDLIIVCNDRKVRLNLKHFHKSPPPLQIKPTVAKEYTFASFKLDVLTQRFSLPFLSIICNMQNLAWAWWMPIKNCQFTLQSTVLVHLTKQAKI